MKETLKPWCGLASHLIGDCFDHSAEFIDGPCDEIDPYVRHVASQLYIGCHLTSESALLLVGEEREWDADLLCRSVLEGTLKFIFMLDGESGEIRKKCEEYWEILPEIAAKRRSDRAEAFLKSIQNPESSEWIPIREFVGSGVPPEAAIHTRLDRRACKQLEQKWSFSEIAKYFLRSQRSELRPLGHLAFEFGMSSHQVHKDADGVGMVLERLGRDPERYSAVKIGHSARIISDICSYAKMRFLILCNIYRKDWTILKTVEERYLPLMTALHQASEDFIKVEYGIPNESINS